MYAHHLLSKAEASSRQTTRYLAVSIFTRLCIKKPYSYCHLKQQSSDTELVCKCEQLETIWLQPEATNTSVHLPWRKQAPIHELVSAMAAEAAGLCGMHCRTAEPWGMPRDRQQVGAGREGIREWRNENPQFCMSQILPSSPFKKEITKGFPAYGCMY